MRSVVVQRHVRAAGGVVDVLFGDGFTVGALTLRATQPGGPVGWVGDAPAYRRPAEWRTRWRRGIAVIDVAPVALGIVEVCIELKTPGGWLRGHGTPAAELLRAYVDHLRVVAEAIPDTVAAATAPSMATCDTATDEAPRSTARR